MLAFFDPSDFMPLSPLFFFWISKKYLSQKNVVEKLNANVMHGKVRTGEKRPQEVMIPCLWSGEVSPFYWPLSLASLRRVRL